MKRTLALLFASLLCLGLLAGCDSRPQEDDPSQPADQQTETEDDGIMKILVIGHSLGVDTMYLMPEVARLQGVENYVMGILYRSAALNYHAGYLKNNKAAYAYFEYVSGEDTVWRRADCNGNFIPNRPGEANDKYIEDGSIAVKAEFALQRHDWDVVITMAGSSEATGRITGNPQEDLNIVDVDAVTKYVLEHDLEPATTPKFGWHMAWVVPQDNTLLNEARKTFLATYFEGSAMKAYESNVATVRDKVAPYLEEKFDFLLPCVTAMQNAKSSALIKDSDIHRDYIHATDYGRLIAAYTWYCGITGTNIRDCKFGPVYHGILIDNLMRNSGKDLVMTELQQNILIEAVENAFKEPYQITVSQYQ